MFLYYITDRKQLSHNDEDARRMLLDRIQVAAEAGIDAIQIREKDLSARDLAELGTRAVEIVRRANASTRLLINSRSDVAIACGADGVHLRADDISPADARSVFMHAGIARPLIGISCHNPSEIELAEGQGADFAVFGSVFEKSGQLAPAGLAALRDVCRHRRTAKPAMPVLALGGVNAANAAECIEAGAGGIAGIRLFQSGRVGDAISRLRSLEVKGEIASIGEIIRER
ncbi:MAG TPA: thiamine phosphate synthase [Terriglobales bacterium]|nr:thiamine phosphate synthase [Terriglobales bacterium]